MRPLTLAILSASLFACVTPVAEPAPPPHPQQTPPPPPPPVEEPVADPGSSPSSMTCGPQEVCPAGSYCRFEPVNSCGEGGGTGVCEPVPQICNRMYAPVCGCDGKTHSNSCEAAGRGVNVRSSGPCESKPTKASCGGIAGKRCPTGMSCADDPDDTCDPKKGGRDCMGMCVAPKSACTPVRCKMHCAKGWQVGPDGCEICACVK